MPNDSEQSLQERLWGEWKKHPQTILFFKLLKAQYEETKERWAAQEFTGSSAEEIAMKQSHALGGVAVVKEWLYMTPADLAEQTERMNENGLE